MKRNNQEPTQQFNISLQDTNYYCTDHENCRQRATKKE